MDEHSSEDSNVLEQQHDIGANTGQHFDKSWSASDLAGLLPGNGQIRRVPRAWERKPYSPFARKTGGSKVWRRVQMPAFTGAPRRVTAAEDDGCAQHQIGGSLLSPKKVVKKLCLSNGFGQDWKSTGWDRVKGAQLRRKALQPPIVLRSGAVIDRDFDEDVQKVDMDEVDEEDNVSELAPAEIVESEWSDVSSEADVDESPVLETIDTAVVSTSSAVKPDDNQEDPDNAQITAHANAHDGEQDFSLEEHPPTLDDHSEVITERVQGDTVTSATQAPKDTSMEIPDSQRIDSPVTDEQHSPAPQLAPFDNLPMLSPYKRPVSAPPEDLQQEARPRPRISDDTAILHAFLNRAAASKKTPTIAKRESLSNRRDSGAVRHALASPAKPEILAELDPNSPSPRKEAASLLSNNDEADSCDLVGSELQEHDDDSAHDEKATRRSGRSRARPKLLLHQMAASQQTRGPNKITIRGPHDQTQLKRSEVQELSIVTRANTRKNKAQSVMPSYRLQELTEEMFDDKQESNEESTRAQCGKSVSWDQTLVYFQEHPSEPAAVQAEAVAVTTLAGDIPEQQQPIATEVAPQSPIKAKSRRAKSVRIEEPTPAPEPTSEPVAAEESDQLEQPKQRTAPIKRKSRIATPAKGLRSANASLLPTEVTAPCQPEPQPATTTLSNSIQKPTRKAPTTRSLPAPRKPNFTASTTTTTTAAADEPSKPTAQAPVTTPKQPGTSSAVIGSGIPSIKSLAPKMSSLSDAPSLTGSVIARERDENVPGLASPAKKRRGAVVKGFGSSTGPASVAKGGKEDEGMRGLSSPAKKRGRALF